MVIILVEEKDGKEIETLLVDRYGYVPTAVTDLCYWGGGKGYEQYRGTHGAGRGDMGGDE